MKSNIESESSGGHLDSTTLSNSDLTIEFNLADVVMPSRDAYKEAAGVFRKLEEFTGDVRDFYSSQIQPLLKESISESGTSSPTPLPALTEMLSDGQVRGRIFLRIAAYGFPEERCRGEQELLIACLVPYVGDNPLYYAAEREIANVAARKYPHLYQALGEHCLAEKLPDACLCFMAGAFLEYATHNATNDPVIAPWVTCFSAVQEPAVYDAMIDELLEQIQKGQLSSYDHIVGVLCATDAKLGKAYLRNFVAPPEFPDDAIVAPPPFGLIAKVGGIATVINSQSLLPIGIAGACITSVLTGVSITTSLAGGAVVIGLLSVGAGVANAVAFREHAWDSAKREYDKLVEFLKGIPYKACVERIYQKLQKPPVGDKIDRQTLELIESHSHYQECLESWKEGTIRAVK